MLKHSPGERSASCLTNMFLLIKVPQESLSDIICEKKMKPAQSILSKLVNLLEEEKLTRYLPYFLGAPGCGFSVDRAN